MKIVRRERVDDSVLADRIADPILRQVLVSRGVTSDKDLDPDLALLLHYRDLKDINAASARIAAAVINKEIVMVCGDYDVDGLTGTALGVLCLKAFGLEKVLFDVPSRYDGGYGLSSKMIDKAKDNGATLIITVDNGIGCHESALYAKEKGIDLVITDHHESLGTLPEALAVVDPKRQDCSFASKNLCGVGVLFYVLIAVRAVLIEKGYYPSRSDAPCMGQFLDLVAIGTIGDVVNLDANNRRLVKAGLQRMQRQNAQIGVKALAEVSRIDMEKIDPIAIAFDLCPRLNAAGRLKLDDNPALLCLLCDDYDKALSLAVKLDFCNRRRSDFEKVMLVEAKEDALLQANDNALVLYRSSWLSGISGLIAGRLKEQYQKPCFVFAGDTDSVTGSARSVPGFSIVGALNRINEEAPDLLLRYGGHSMAAGATLKVSDLKRFKDLLNKEAMTLLDKDEQEVLSDGCLPEPYLKDLNFALALESCGPWGQGFPEPVFDGVFYIEEARVLANRHVRFRLRSDNTVFSAIRFRASVYEKNLLPGIEVKAAFSVGVDRYFANERVEIKIEYIEPV
ncbi:single-stranded-DNA-specific exonuclease RecJ [uncultured Succinatimonas sp.]|uniref:single-stranded-DNA-specific exonuclease RecJ n=1 Tax=uncultured Succinatimonas sp. TaxID=1262973 RepID=UPI0025EEC819|nr:single-stranded-DNA-specific exonuclease RecJ [uncultured Succinatimonas sp.]